MSVWCDCKWDVLVSVGSLCACSCGLCEMRVCGESRVCTCRMCVSMCALMCVTVCAEYMHTYQLASGVKEAWIA